MNRAIQVRHLADKVLCGRQKGSQLSGLVAPQVCTELLRRGKSRAVFPQRAVSVLSDGFSVSKAKEAGESSKGRSVGCEQQVGHQAWQCDSGSLGAQRIRG